MNDASVLLKFDSKYVIIRKINDGAYSQCFRVVHHEY